MLDLRRLGERTASAARHYDRIAGEIRAPYADWIGELGDSVQHSLDWWLESTATRNPVLSGLYHQVVSLLTLRACMADGLRPDRVLVDSPAMADAVRRLLGDPGVRVQGPAWSERIGTMLRRWLSPWRSMFALTRQWHAARAGPGRTRPADGAILVDTFAIPGFVARDRYYPGLLEQAGDAGERLLFVPQFFNLVAAEIRGAVSSLAPENHLVKEQWLGWRDLAWCFLHIFRLRGAMPRRAWFRDMDLTRLVREDVGRRLGFRCAVRGLMNYRFAGALARAGIRPALIIDWFENHPMDRGWNAGFNRYFGDTPRAGYLGFYPSGMAYRPTAGERRAGLLPPRFLLIGDGFRRDMAEFLPDIRCDRAPAFRYPQWPASAPARAAGGSRAVTDILVAMPYYDAMCRVVLAAVAHVQARRPNWRFLIKAHPATPLRRFTESAPVMQGNAVETEDSLDRLLPRCSAMITGSQASTILESAALGIPAVIVHRPGFPAEVSIPGVMPADFVRVCHDGGSTLAVLDELVDAGAGGSDDRSARALQFQRDCFTPVNRETVAAMLVA